MFMCLNEVAVGCYLNKTNPPPPTAHILIFAYFRIRLPKPGFGLLFELPFFIPAHRQANERIQLSDSLVQSRMQLQQPT